LKSGKKGEGAKSAQTRHKKGTKKAQNRHKTSTNVFHEKGAKFCAKFRHKTAQKEHKNCTKHVQNKTQKRTKQAQNMDLVATIIPLSFTGCDFLEITGVTARDQSAFK
jgi:hypothetical protein